MSQPVAQITITLLDNGQVSVNGPLQDKILCYGLMEIAKETVKTIADKAASEQRVIRSGSFCLYEVVGKFKSSI